MNSREETPDVEGKVTKTSKHAQVTGQADVGASQNVVFDFANSPNHDKEEEDLTPVHVPNTSLSTPSTPTRGEDQHIIVMEPSNEDGGKTDNSIAKPQMESTV